MTTDTTALQDRLWDAIFQSRDLDSEEQAPTENIVAAVLPIIAEEARKAKAEALRETSAHISDTVDNAQPWQTFTEHVLYEAGVCDYLDRAATEYETGDEHDDDR